MTRTLAARARTVWNAMDGPSDAWLAARILAAALIVRLAKYVVPLPRLVAAMTPPPPGEGSRDHRRESRIALFAGWSARVVRPRDAGNCLERSVVLYRELARAHARPRLCIGFRREDSTILGHAWVLVDGVPVADSAHICDRYQVAMVFDPGQPRRSAA
jgi:Transglutaminase-like superfamily